MSRRPEANSEELDRAVRLSLLPGMTLAQCCQLAGVSLAALKRARKASAIRLTRDDLLLAALTQNGTQREGLIGELAALASWLDYVNHDGSGAVEVARDLDRLVQSGQLVIEGARFRLLKRWP